MQSASSKKVDKSYFQSIYQQKIPIEVVIASFHCILIPQHPDTAISWILHLIQQIYPGQILKDDSTTGNQLYIQNYTRGRNYGRVVSMNSTSIYQLLEDCEAGTFYPVIRIQWTRPTQLYRVKVDLHDLLEFSYQDITLFNTFSQIMQIVSEQLQRELKLKDKSNFALQLHGQYINVKPSSYVDGYFQENKQNLVEILIIFKEGIPITVAKQTYSKDFQSLICPITHLIMKKPVVTVCGHIFDHFSLLLSLIKNKTCPLCRTYLNPRKLKMAMRYKRKIEKLKQIYLEQRIINLQKERKQIKLEQEKQQYEKQKLMALKMEESVKKQQQYDQLDY